jgi:hypothetical protein
MRLVRFEGQSHVTQRKAVPKSESECVRSPISTNDCVTYVPKKIWYAQRDMRAKTMHDSLNTKNQPTKKPLEIIATDASQGLMIGQTVTPMGIEQLRNSQGKSPSVGDVPMPVPISCSDHKLRELIELWADLDAAARDDLIKLARSLAGDGARG